MKRFHLHMGVEDLESSIAFYTGLFGQKPSKVKTDYAKWMLEDPRINFAISTRMLKPGVDHLGIQVDSAEELISLRKNFASASIPSKDDGIGACCYAQSDKSWLKDPSGVSWEAYHTMNDVEVFGEKVKEESICCPAPASKKACC